MAYSIRHYRGIWQPRAESEAPASKNLPAVSIPPPESEIQDRPDSNGVDSWHRDLLHHQLTLLHLADHRQQLGRKFLLYSFGGPTQLLLTGMGSFGWNYRVWAHARLFALANYLNLELPPRILPSLRHPWHFFRYLNSTFWLWSLLGMVAGKELQPAPPVSLFRLTRVCPPLFIWLFERQLQNILGQSLAQGQRWQTRTPSSG